MMINFENSANVTAIKIIRTTKNRMMTKYSDI